MANSHPEFPVSKSRRKCLGSGPLACAQPIIDASASKYSIENRKPIILQKARAERFGCDSRSTYHHDFQFFQSPKPHVYHDVPAHEIIAHSKSSLDFALNRESLSGDYARPRCNKVLNSSCIPGLDRSTLIDYTRYQDPKEIIQTHPDTIIKPYRDIRYQRKYRTAYLDPEIASDDRYKYRLQPPGTLPPLSKRQVKNLLTSPDEMPLGYTPACNSFN